MTHDQNIRVSSVLGNSQWLDGGAMFGNAPRALWERWAKPDELGRILLACRSMLIEIDGVKILCETGIGAYLAADLADRYGRVESEHKLLANLGEMGIAPEAIDYVILSHLHFDHAGGMLSAYGQPEGLVFPNAKIVIGQEAWQRAQFPHARDRASFIPDLTRLIMDSGRLCLVQGDCIPDFPRESLSFRYSHGHTPGQMHTLVQGHKHSILFAGDLIPGKAWMHLPITMGYDRFAEQVIDEKQSLYHEAVPGHWLLFFTHDPHIAAAGVEIDAKGRYLPTGEQAGLHGFKL